jgi:hypothetical protein
MGSVRRGSQALRTLEVRFATLLRLDDRDDWVSAKLTDPLNGNFLLLGFEARTHGQAEFRVGNFFGNGKVAGLPTAGEHDSSSPYGKTLYGKTILYSPYVRLEWSAMKARLSSLGFSLERSGQARYDY